MNLDGITFFGVPLRISRPHDYVAGPTEMLMSDPAMAGMNQMNAQLMQATKKARRIHIGNLPVGVGLTAVSLKDFVSNTMQQLSLTVKPGESIVDCFLSQEGKFGFIEFRTIAEANNSLALTGLDLIGRPIKMARPSDYIPLAGEVLQQCDGTGILGTPGDVGVPVVGLPSAEPDVDVSKATEVLLIKNMLSVAELADDNECKEIAQDTVEKCQEDFGKVEALIIVRPGKDGIEESIVGQVYVQFTSKEDAIKAAQGLNRVKFDDRVVATDFAV